VRKLAFGTAVLLAATALWGGGQAPPVGRPAVLPWPAGLPVYKHVVIVIEENKDYEEIIGSDAASYINQLRKEGANFTQMYGEEHNSQGNYFWLFSGSNQNVGFEDAMPTKENNPNYPFTTPNLGTALWDKSLTFKGYSEDLPYIGFEGEYFPAEQDYKKRRYVRKHAPWVNFSNLPKGNSVETSCNLRFADFPTDEAGFAALPTVAIVVPNLENDMHNQDPDRPDDCIRTGDAWLRKNIDAYYCWAKKNNSLLIVTFDESNNKREKGVNYLGLTNPLVRPKPRPADQYKRDLQNHIPTIFAGARVKPGEYGECNGITHVNILRTLEAMYGLPRAGFQQPNAAGAGIRDDYLITDVFEKMN
jgi:acid phosphatase